VAHDGALTRLVHYAGSYKSEQVSESTIDYALVPFSCGAREDESRRLHTYVRKLTVKKSVVFRFQVKVVLKERLGLVRQLIRAETRLRGP
jgi:hypothetical protein